LKADVVAAGVAAAAAMLVVVLLTVPAALDLGGSGLSELDVEGCDCIVAGERWAALLE
jgi:hypothetical protein